MPDQISTEDLYGPSSGSTPAPSTPVSSPVIPVEETPEIPMNTVSSPSVPPPPPAPKASFGVGIAVLILFAGLFGLGVWLSSFFRQYLPSNAPTPAQQASGTIAPTPKVPLDPFATWKSYFVVSGATKLPVTGIAFQLPPNVLSPICDSASCVSQGTYLPGGTRFTVAARGTGQLLADFRGRVVSDVGGIIFTTKEATVSGHKAQEFTGIFTGQTVSGYAFSRMRGLMIEVGPTLSLEINHFTPSGITADFAADDTLFNQIVKTVSFSSVAVTPTLVPVITVAPIATSTPKPATSSGY